MRSDERFARARQAVFDPIHLYGMASQDADVILEEFRAAAEARSIARVAELMEGLEGMVRQFAYWSEGAGGYMTGGLSTLEEAFELLGWDDPQPAPEARCDEPGCLKTDTCGWPTRLGGTGANGGYRRTCWDHSSFAAEKAAALFAPQETKEK